MQGKSGCFTRNLEAFGKFTTALYGSLLYSHNQDLVNQDQLLATADFITKTDCPVLERMPGDAVDHEVLSKDLP